MSVPPDLLADLTPDQQTAVVHAEGPLLILAGAGSGKTRVITRRVAYLLQQGVKPWNILAITFTNKASQEMRARVEALVPGNKVWVSTFHSLGARLLRQYADRLGFDRNFTIYDVDDRNKLVKDALNAAGIDDVRYSPERIAGAISKAKNQLLTPPQYERTATDFFSQTVAKVYGGYERRLRSANAMDFDDLLYLPAMALKTNEELRRDLDARFRYVLIDEYQDTNMAQYEIAKRLSLDHNNLCVVGDPDQCVPAGTEIMTPGGARPVETIREGDAVITAAGRGKVIRQRVSAVMVNPHRGNLVTVTLSNGMELRATANHVCFARVPAVTPKGWDGFHPEGVGEYSPGSPASGAPWVRDAHHEVLHPEGVRECPRVRSLSQSFRLQNPGGWASVTQGARRSAATLGYTLPPLRGENQSPEFEESPALNLLRNELFRCIRAGNLCPGLVVPVYENGRLVEAEITDVEFEEYDGNVYDLTVPETHNFVANGVVVHNSIYKWRGSDIKNILDFERDFPTARVITLTQNYRSTKGILRAASQLIDHNKQRKKKNLVTDNPEGEPVRVLTFDNGLDEAEGVVVRIKEAVKDGRFKYRDHAIFMRINALTRSLESAFVKHGVPFQIVKGLAFFDRKENRDVLAYLRLVVNPADTVSFLRAVNEPPRGVGKISLDRLQSYAAAQEIPLFAAASQVAKIPDIKGKGATGLRDFFRLISDLRTQLALPPQDLIKLVIEKSGYSKMLRESSDEDDAERLANIEELVTAAKQFHDENPDRTTIDFLEQITLASDVDAWNEETDHVSVMTLHSSKGLEFPVVYVMAVEEGLLPHERSMGKDEEVEEERRLCFVGMTRAMKELFLCHARLREFRGQMNYAIPSSFLRELPTDVEHIDISTLKNQPRSALDEWRAKVGNAARDWADTGAKPYLPPKKPTSAETANAAEARTAGIKPTIPDPPDTGYGVGMVVQHEEYGIGTITDVSGFGAMRYVKIRFAGVGEKKFAADKVKLRVIARKS